MLKIWFGDRDPVGFLEGAASSPHIHCPSPSAAVQDCLLRVEAGIIDGPWQNPFIVLVVAARMPCALARRALTRVGGATVQHNETLEIRVVCSIAFWTRRTSRTWSLDCDPRCFTESFRAVDSRIAASSWRWRHPTSLRVS